MKYKYLLLSVVLLICLNACKKDSKTPAPTVTIAAKWFITEQSSELYFNGEEISSFVDTTFTSVDFVEYYSDGTGYFSRSSSTGPSLTEFTYTLKGSALTQYISNVNTGTPETVTDLTVNSLSIHAVSQIADPNNPSQNDTEIDDYTYKR
jgi:hypothetical protein